MANHSWSSSPQQQPQTDQNWSLAAAAAPYYDRPQPQQMILERQSPPPAAAKQDFKRTVGEGRRGSKEANKTAAAAAPAAPAAESNKQLQESKQSTAKTTNGNNNNNQNSTANQFQVTANNHEKRFKSLPSAEVLPRNVTLGGYIFVCNNDTMQEDLKRQLFGTFSL